MSKVVQDSTFLMWIIKFLKELSEVPIYLHACKLGNSGIFLLTLAWVLSSLFYARVVATSTLQPPYVHDQRYLHVFSSLLFMQLLLLLFWLYVVLSFISATLYDMGWIIFYLSWSLTHIKRKVKKEPEKL